MREPRGMVLEFDPKQVEAIEKARETERMRETFKEMNESWECRKRVNAILAEFNKLPLNGKIREGTTLLTRAYGELTSRDKKFVSILFWVLWLLSGLTATDSVSSKPAKGEDYRVGNLFLLFFIVCSGMV